MLPAALLRRSASGSALVLVLLVTALLTATVVGFLSTARIEQLAARNFSQQNAAAGLAEVATQQAMGKIQQGFTVNGTGATVITTQPGRIRQFAFTAGNCTLVAQEELFSGTGNATTTGTANLNNLQNPLNFTANAAANQWTITGDAGETIEVPLEEVTISENGTDRVVGRIAYYVDDEGTKLNANAATGNRASLNAVVRPLDIGALSGSAPESFNQIISASSGNSSSILSWNYFFRPEQVAGALGDISEELVPFLSTAASSANSTDKITHLLTPWGTQRLYINELPITTASVNRTFSSLSGINSFDATADDLANGQALNNIFGGDFSTKYSSLGVKQIGANLLQMRDPKTFSINASGNYSGPLLGADNLDANGIPREYLGYAPYPVISEIGFSCILSYYYYVDQDRIFLRVIMCPTVELYNPYPFDFVFKSGYPRLIVAFSDLSFDINYTYNGTTGNVTINNSINSPIIAYANFPGSYNPRLRDDKMSYDALVEFLPKNSDGFTYIPAKTKVQTHFNVHEAFGPLRYNIELNDYITINSVSSNAAVDLKYVKLIANSNNGTSDIYAGHENTIRDWVAGDEIGQITAQLKPYFSLPFTTAQTLSKPSFGAASPFPSKNGSGGYPLPVPANSASRLSFLNRYPVSAIPDNEPNWDAGPGLATWSTNSSTKFGIQGNTTETNPNGSGSLPSEFSTQPIPSDPSWSDSLANAVYADASEAADMREPFLATGNYTCPADLGLVPTNKQWRRLRMQMQPAAEGALIPDWAMLDVIAFGNSTDANLPYNRFQPVNINGRFHLPGNASVAPRTIGIQALAKVLEVSSNATLSDPLNPASSSLIDATKFKGATANATVIANAIGNMTWSANSTWDTRRSALRFPSDQYILPSEIMEIAGVADAVSQTDYNNSNSHFKRNEGRASALIPAVTTRSSFFTIYAYAQALDAQGRIDSESLVKTLVEVEIETPATATTPTVYRVKKLYSQPIPLGM